MKRGIIIVIAITLLSFTGLFLFSNTETSFEELKKIKIYYLLLTLSLVFLDWWLGGWRNNIFVRKVVPGISQRVCFDANLACMFMGAITPSQTGGGPMHLYMLYRNGVKLTHGIAISVINFISTIIVFVIFTGAAFWILRETEINSTLFTLIKSGFSIFTTLFTFIIVGLVAPQFIARVLTRIDKILSKIAKKYQAKISKFINKVKSSLLEYNQSIKVLLLKNPSLFPYSLFITAVMYFNKYLIAYTLLLGLGYSGNFMEIIAVQAITFFLLYYAPTPGASGIAEFSIAVLMGPFIPVAGIVSFTILHRTFLLILPAIAGAFVVFPELKRHSEGKSKVEYPIADPDSA